jgi:hypothetical protein
MQPDATGENLLRGRTPYRSGSIDEHLKNI